MNEKVYDPKMIEQQIRDAKWAMFVRICLTFSTWASVVLIFGGLLVLLTTP